MHLCPKQKYTSIVTSSLYSKNTNTSYWLNYKNIDSTEENWYQWHVWLFNPSLADPPSNKLTAVSKHATDGQALCHPVNFTLFTPLPHNPLNSRHCSTISSLYDSLYSLNAPKIQNGVYIYIYIYIWFCISNSGEDGLDPSLWSPVVPPTDTSYDGG